MQIRRIFLAAGLLLLLPLLVFAKDALPPKPTRYFNDYAGVISPQTVATLNARLENFEQETSNQVVVAIFKNIPTDYTMEDFAQRTFESWGVGQKAKNNGVVLFVFTQARKVRIEVGYGLEGALPDITAAQIIRNDITPQFRAGNYDAGLTAAINSIFQAIKGEYKGTGRTRAEAQGGNNVGTPFIFVFLIVMIIFFIIGWKNRRRGVVYGSGGNWWIGGGGGGFGGGGSGGGGGFSGGGGGSGGGGASGGW
ncbi:MAG: TPM domain-containing protein [Chthoniobacterales bacterium]